MQSIQNSDFVDQHNSSFSGIRFLVDALDRKTGVLLDLSEHQTLWNAIEADFDAPLSVQFVVNHQGDRTAVILDFEQHGDIWEDVYDHLVADSRSNEPIISLEAVKASLFEQSQRCE